MIEVIVILVAVMGRFAFANGYGWEGRFTFILAMACAAVWGPLDGQLADWPMVAAAFVLAGCGAANIMAGRTAWQDIETPSSHHG